MTSLNDEEDVVGFRNNSVVACATTKLLCHKSLSTRVKTITKTCSEYKWRSIQLTGLESWMGTTVSVTCQNLTIRTYKRICSIMENVFLGLHFTKKSTDRNTIPNKCLRAINVYFNWWHNYRITPPGTTPTSKPKRPKRLQYLVIKRKFIMYWQGEGLPVS